MSTIQAKELVAKFFETCHTQSIDPYSETAKNYFILFGGAGAVDEFDRAVAASKRDEELRGQNDEIPPIYLQT